MHSSSSSSTPLTTIFYGWYVLGASFIILFFNSGARISFGVVFKPLVAEFGWSRAALSAVFFLHMATYAGALVVAGILYDRYGPRWIIIGSTMLLSAGFMLTAMINSMWQLILCYGVLAGIGLGGTSVPLIASIMSKWFNRWRGLAISIALSGHSLGQFVLVPLCTNFVTYYDWRLTYLILGLLMLAVNVLLALWIIRGDPDELGHKPYGTDPTSPNTMPVVTTAASSNAGDLNLKKALCTSSLWFFFIVMFICGGGDFWVTTHLVPFVTDHGLSTATGGQILAWYGPLSLVGLLVAGPISDLFGCKLPIALTFLLRLFLFLLIMHVQTQAALYGFALAFGFTHLITAPLTPVLVGRLYGLSHVGVIAGIVTTIHHLSGGLWTYIGGEIFDRTGSYQLVFLLSAIAVAIAFLCSLLIQEQRHPRT